jgi:hypothetical protein
LEFFDLCLDFVSEIKKELQNISEPRRISKRMKQSQFKK